jgi:ubiquinone/menaquinone biosynthesis C-methylase UbiE
MGIPTNDIYWGDFVATESHLRILGDVKRKRILEIGCGGAQNSIVLSKWGAEAVGIDLSNNQILHAKQLAKKEDVGVSLILGNMEELPFKDEVFDIVTTAVSLHYVPDLNAAFAEANRVLTKGGRFCFSASHPLTEGKLTTFRNKQAVAVRDYFKRRIVRWTDKIPDGSKVKMHSYYRPLQDYFDMLIENGFIIERYIELERLEEDKLHPLDREKIKMERGARQQYRIMEDRPYWIIFKVRKSRQRKR